MPHYSSRHINISDLSTHVSNMSVGEIMKKLHQSRMLPTLDSYYDPSNKKTAARIARDFPISPVILYKFDNKGSLWAHAGVTEVICNILGDPGAADEVVIPTILNAEVITKNHHENLKKAGLLKDYIALFVKAERVRECCSQADLHLGALKKWIERSQKRKSSVLEQVFYEEYEKLSLIANVIGVEDILGGFETLNYCWTALPCAEDEV